MKKKVIAILIVLISWLLNAHYVESENITGNVKTDNDQAKIGKLIEEANSNDPVVRLRAANEIITLYYHKGIKIKEAVPGLIKELEAIDFEHLTEATGEYGANLIYILGEYRDERAIPAMLNVIGHAGGSLTIEAFAKMGSAVIGPLINKLSDNKNIKGHAIIYLGRVPVKMKEYGYFISEQDKYKIKDVLKGILKDRDESFREKAIEALDDIKNIYLYEEMEDVIPLLESLAKEDPFVKKRKVNETEEEIYPVREKALKTINNLNKLQKKSIE